ncbi:MAG: diaminopimelate epimerase [Acidimicrobiales bacterium]
MAQLELAKYEALGNDFLFLVDWGRAGRFDAQLARALCDRHRGVGADGLIRLSAPSAGGDMRMDLLNADGSAAETSGNGLRCAVLCARETELVSADRLVVETGAGPAAAVLAAADGDHPVSIRVGIGAVRVEALTATPVEGRRAWRVDVGNPHLVLIGDAPVEVDLAVLGPSLEAAIPGGQNVEVVAARAGTDELDLVVWERGAGLTLACGSGSAAAAAAANAAGLVGPVVVVHNPGGDLVVELVSGGTAVEATLVGSARFVARVLVTPSGDAG